MTTLKRSQQVLCFAHILAGTVLLQLLYAVIVTGISFSVIMTQATLMHLQSFLILRTLE